MKGARLQTFLRRGLALQLLFAALTAGAAVVLFVGYRDESRRSDEVRESLLALQALRAEVLSSETGLRGYALTRSASSRHTSAPSRSSSAASRSCATGCRRRRSRG
jgi:hypothetical protein